MWLPRTHEISIRNCADPPPKQTIADVLCTVMQTVPRQGEPFDSLFLETARLIKRNPPETRWMLAILSTVDANHPFFAKDYVKPRVNVHGNDANLDNMVANKQGFFTGLPAAAKRSKKRGNVKFPST